MLAYTTESIIQVYLPASIDPTSLLNIIIQIRDTFDCVTEFNLSTVVVLSNLSAIDNLQETVTTGQIINSISEILNEINDQNIHFLPDSISDLHNQFFNRVSFLFDINLNKMYLNRYLIQRIPSN